MIANKKDFLGSLLCIIMLAGDEGFEPPNARTRTWCLTTWPIPNAYLVQVGIIPENTLKLNRNQRRVVFEI
jgi:hypothetical protein